jgi:septal ring factor EnvC (AmiA/AmiB activator)
MATTGKLETLRQRADKLKAQIAQLEAAESARKRKEDTRLKVLVGAATLADVELHPETRAGVEAVLKRGIVAPRDREFLKAKGWL